jgi:hypothetical protein
MNGAIPPLPHVPSWHTQGQFYLLPYNYDTEYTFHQQNKYLKNLCPYWKEEKKTVAEFKRILVLV